MFQGSSRWRGIRGGGRQKRKTTVLSARSGDKVHGCHDVDGNHGNDYDDSHGDGNLDNGNGEDTN